MAPSLSEFTQDETDHSAQDETNHRVYDNSSHTILSTLSNFDFDMPENDFWSELKTISWCPVCISPMINGLPWCKSTDRIASPFVTRPKSQMWHVSSTLRILDGDCNSIYLHKQLGWLDTPGVRILSKQLIDISRSYSELKVASREIPVDGILQKEMLLIYSKLQELVGTNDFSILKQELDGFAWIYIGDRFVAANELAFDSPVKYHPYLYVVPSELSEFKSLLSELGVRLTFDALDYKIVLQRLQKDTKGEPLSTDQLTFVHCVLEAFADCNAGNQTPEMKTNALLIPNSWGILVPATHLVYNDAPWLSTSYTSKQFVHSSIEDDLSRRLGVQSLRGLSLVDEELVRDLTCIDYAAIRELLALYGESDFVLFDLLELADYANASKVHFIYDKREHPRQSLLQQSLGEYQGPSLTVVFEGTSMNREEVCSLLLPPPWKLRGSILNYGLGLLSCYFVCDVLMVLSNGYFYMVDPLGLTLGTASSGGSSAKLFSLSGTDLAERFRDQFRPMYIAQEVSLSSANSTVIRMPLSPNCTKEVEAGKNRLTQILQRLTQNSSPLLFLRSITQVSLSTWENGASQPSLDYSFYVDPSVVPLRNPFTEKKWRKFQISRLFSSTNEAVKMHVIDIHVIEGGSSYVDKWFVVLSLGSGQTRNMALDRRYIAYNLTPVAGVAAHISRNGNITTALASGCLLAPLPLSGCISMPVTTVGHFLVRHNTGRYIFGNQHERSLPGLDNSTKDELINAWNKELLLCVRDSYIELVLEFQKLRTNPHSSALEPRSASIIAPILSDYGDKIYSFWPRSKLSSVTSSDKVLDNSASSSKASAADWESLIEQVIRPFYLRLAELPVWQLYRGNLVKVDEGMFLYSSGGTETDDLPSPSVCNFIKEQYPVFSVPRELALEIQAVGITVREIKPKMVRDLLKRSSSIPLRSIDTYIDVLEYCLSDIHHNLVTNTYLASSSAVMHDEHTATSSGLNLPSNSNLPRVSNAVQPGPSTSGGDALEIMTYVGKAVYDFGRGVVEDFSRTGGAVGTSPSSNLSYVVSEIKGVPFITATKKLAKLGMSELWTGTREEQLVMRHLEKNFIHLQCLDKPSLAALLSIPDIHGDLKLRPFSASLLSSQLQFLFDERWLSNLARNKMPWVYWDHTSSSSGPSSEWLRSFWRVFWSLKGDLSLIGEWPLIPAFLDAPVLCRVKEREIVFVPPLVDPNAHHRVQNGSGGEGDTEVTSGDTVLGKDDALRVAFESINLQFPWLLGLLCKLNIPIYDFKYPECEQPCKLAPSHGQTLGHIVVSKLLAAKNSSCLPMPVHLTNEECDKLFGLFVSDFSSSSNHSYRREELDVLKGIPMYRTVLGSYTSLTGNNCCLISPASFFNPSDSRCLSCSADAIPFLHALGIEELSDQEVLVQFALQSFGTKTVQEQEDILSYIYANWQDLQQNHAVVNTLKETKFVANVKENSSELFKPNELLDPSDSLLASVFADEQQKFPAERFTSDVWIRILRKTGIRTSLEPDMIIQCAKKVEIIGIHALSSAETPDEFDLGTSSQRNEISLEIWSLGESVVNTILTNFANFYNSAFCEKIGSIAFVPAEKGIPSVGGKTGGKRVLSSYSESVLLKDWPLAWHVAPIINKQSLVPPEYSWAACRLRSPPYFSTVLKHLQTVGRGNGEDILAHWPTSQGLMKVEEAFLQILHYLNNIWGTLSSSDKRELETLAFIPVANGTRLVTVKSLFARLSISMSPFAFELPSLYLPFINILKEIGMRESLTVSYARDLLLSVQKACGYQRLNPNELRAVMEILGFIFSEISQAASNGSSWVTDLVIPDDGSRLVPARSCVYIDPDGSRFLGSIDISRLRFCHPELPENICHVLGIKKLSDIVFEELDTSRELQVVSNIGSVSLNQIRVKLMSKSLQSALWTLITSMTNHFPFAGMNLLQIERLLENTADKLQFVQCLYTRFLLHANIDITRVVRNSAIPDWSADGRHRSIFFINKSNSNILVAEPPSFMTVYDVIANVISQILGAPMVLPIGSLFACPDGSEKEVLTILKQGSEFGVLKHEGRYKSAPGSDLLTQDALQVQFLPLRPYYSGEIIAWKDKDHEKLKYGRVDEDIRPSAGQALYRFSVETAPGKTQMLLSTQVYSFKSTGMMSSSLSMQSPADSSLSAAGNNVLAQTSSSDSENEASNQTAKLQYGKASPAELLQAVHDMLSAAGLSLDAEKQELMREKVHLQDQLSESQVSLLVEQEKAEAAVREAEEAKTAWSCRICLSTEVNTAIIPCGHVLCQRCSGSVSRCPFCRTLVSRTIKIFRP